MKITKAQVIKAIETEPLLKGGEFFAVDKNNLFDALIDECPVCVVGAVLRQTGVVNTKTPFYTARDAAEMATKYQYSIDDLETPAELIKDKNYLGALSVKFEKLTVAGDKPVTPARRRTLVAFVEKYFPKSFTVG